MVYGQVDGHAFQHPQHLVLRVVQQRIVGKHLQQNFLCHLLCLPLIVEQAEGGSIQGWRKQVVEGELRPMPAVPASEYDFSVVQFLQ